MKIIYQFADGTKSEVEVDEALGNYITASRRKEDNYERKMRYHCPFSIDKLLYEGLDFADQDTPDTLYTNKYEESRVAQFLATLTDVQRRRVEMLMDGMTVSDVARAEGASWTSVKETLKQVQKKYQIFFKDTP